MSFLGRRGRSWSARLREIRIIVRATLDPRRPLLVHMIPMRRCNLACGYCNEYDKHSPPVPTQVMFERIDRLAALGTAVVTISGGEPLLHPDLEVLIRRVHDRGMVVTLITNGLLLSADRIHALNAARLDRLQISIDNLKPDAVSKKSLQVLDQKLVLLAKHAAFDININSVVGGGTAHPEDALIVARRAGELGFTSTMGIIHNGLGHLKPLAAADRDVYDRFQVLNRFSLARFNWSFQNNLAAGRPNDWRCRAGSRYFYVCEDGLVHYCSQQRGTPAIPLLQYTLADIRKAYSEKKACAPFCTIACAHQASSFDRWRGPQRVSAPRIAVAQRPTAPPVPQTTRTQEPAEV